MSRNHNRRTGDVGIKVVEAIGNIFQAQREYAQVRCDSPDSFPNTAFIVSGFYLSEVQLREIQLDPPRSDLQCGEIGRFFGAPVFALSQQESETGAKSSFGGVRFSYVPMDHVD